MPARIPCKTNLFDRDFVDKYSLVQFRILLIGLDSSAGYHGVGIFNFSSIPKFTQATLPLPIENLKCPHNIYIYI
jgi:hypothetical protein